MASTHGASLQSTNNELVKCIEDLRARREQTAREIVKQQEEKAKIENDIKILTDRLHRVTDSLTRREQTMREYDKTIQDTESAYAKIVESSATLLQVLKRETSSLNKASGSAV